MAFWMQAEAELMFQRTDHRPLSGATGKPARSADASKGQRPFEVLLSKRLIFHTSWGATPTVTDSHVPAVAQPSLAPLV